MLADNSVRALATLMGSEVGNAKYAEGVHLLHPAPSEMSEETVKFDVVLVHGVGGDPLGTWRAGENDHGWLQKS